jgi:hypothetical protein
MLEDFEDLYKVRKKAINHLLAHKKEEEWNELKTRKFQKSYLQKETWYGR